MSSWREQIEKIELRLRLGEHQLAEAFLRSLARRRGALTREAWLPVSALARRLGVAEIGLRLLHPLVREGRAESPATALEIAEYAAVLLRLGAVSEAEGLLGSLSFDDDPFVALYRAFACVQRWSYAEALPWLDRYLKVVPASYARRVAEVNRAAALVAIDQFELGLTAAEIIAESVEKRDERVLWMNCMEIQAQALLGLNRVGEALRCLERAQDAGVQAAPSDELFVSKWRAVAEFRNGRKISSSRNKFAHIRNRSSELQHWESVRDIDFHLAHATGDRARLNRLYWGTPFPALKARYLISLGGKADQFERSWGDDEPAEIVEASALDLEPGSHTTKAFVALNQDFYRPARVAGLFELLYPGEHYHPQRSPQRVHKACSRLRAHLAVRRSALTVVYCDAGWKLEAKNGRVVLRGLESLTEAKLPSKLSRFLENERERGIKTLSATDLAKRLRLSPRTAQRYLAQAAEAGWLVSEGSRRYRTHRFIRHDSSVQSPAPIG